MIDLANLGDILANGETVTVTNQQPCGCESIAGDDGVAKYHPCVPCALIGAGEFLRAAGARWHETAAQEAADADAAAEPPQYMGGSD